MFVLLSFLTFAIVAWLVWRRHPVAAAAVLVASPFPLSPALAMLKGWRWCARWAGWVFLVAGAAVPPPVAAQVPAKQTIVIINWTATTADTFALDQAPAKIVLWLGRDTTATRAHLICGYSYVTAGAQPFPFAIRWAGDTLRHVVATWRPICLSP